MSPRTKVFLKLKAQQIGIALTAVAFSIAIVLGLGKLNTMHGEWVETFEPFEPIRIYAPEMAPLDYFINHPLWYWDQHRQGPLNDSFYRVTPHNLFLHIIMSAFEWAIFLAFAAIIFVAVVGAIYWLSIAIRNWIRHNWEKAGIIVGDIKPKKTRKRK